MYMHVVLKTLKLTDPRMIKRYIVRPYDLSGGQSYKGVINVLMYLTKPVNTSY